MGIFVFDRHVKEMAPSLMVVHRFVQIEENEVESTTRRVRIGQIQGSNEACRGGPPVEVMMQQQTYKAE